MGNWQDGRPRGNGPGPADGRASVMGGQVPMGEVDVLTEVVIDRPRPVVSRFVMDPENAPKWYANIRSVEWVSGPPLRPGARIAFVARFLGRRLSYTYEVVELEPEERLVMRTAEGPFPMETTYVLEALDAERTHMQLRNRGTPRGFGQLVASAMAWAIRRENRKDLRKLKSLLEAGRAGGRPTGEGDQA